MNLSSNSSWVLDWFAKSPRREKCPPWLPLPGLSTYFRDTALAPFQLFVTNLRIADGEARTGSRPGPSPCCG
jgi:hypothetical protein